MDIVIWWVGVATIAVSTTGLLALLVAWATEQAVKLFGFHKALLEAYVRLQTDRMHERQKGMRG